MSSVTSLPSLSARSTTSFSSFLRKHTTWLIAYACEASCIVQEQGILVGSPQIGSTRWELLRQRMIQTLADGLLIVEAWLLLEKRFSQPNQLQRPRTVCATDKYVRP